MIRTFSFFLSLLLVALCACEGKWGQEPTPEVGISPEELKAGFLNPPNSAKPRTWFHAMSGNMSKEGITKDLESMAEVGIGGLLLFNVTQGIPNGDITYDSPEHHEMISHAAQEAERLGLSFGVHNCDGWSSSGGPWVTSDLSMKMVVWSETVVPGGTVSVDLARPTARHNYYEDIAVVAYPALASDREDHSLHPTLSASDPNFDLSLATDGKTDAMDQLGPDANGETWLQFSYDQVRTLRSAEAIFTDRNGTVALLASDDGKTFRKVQDIFKVRTAKSEWAVNDHFPAVTARHFRLRFNQGVTLKEATLSSTFRLHNRMGRTALGRTEDRRLTPIGIPASSMVVNRKELIDLTDKLDAKGHLTTKLPAGEWTILRFGQTTTGATNHPASEEGRGLEVDKLSREAFKVHYDAFVGEVVERNKTLAPNALQYAEIDSYEMGGQNWTDGFNESFARAKGYDIMDYLPLLAGRFVDDATTSETVLRDFRGHICDLMTKNYFAYFTELCHEDGILSYVEPYGFGPLNNLEVGGTCDLPMGEFWVGREMNRVESAISSAHIYGKLVISAEAFTTRPGLNWKGHPAMAKTTGDQAWAAGINEFMFHRFAHQANTHVSPGMTMNRWGFHFDRTQTWWDNAGKDWFEYMARGQFLLRQGVPVADLAVFVGDGAPNGVYYRNDFAPALPANLNFDCINADVLLNRAKVSNGQLVLPEGTTYKLLALKNSKAMTLSTLRVLSEFSKAGLPLVGDVPERMLGFQRPEAETAEFNRLRAVLANKILPWNKWNDLLSDLQITPDAHFSGREDLTYAHRRIGDQDVYFIYNPDSLSTTLAITFRSSAYAPESWDALTGEQYRLTDFVQEKGTTRLTLNLEPKQSRFIVFRSEAPELPPLPQLAVTNQTLAIAGPWQVTFSEANGYGGEETFTELVDWSAHSNEAINYYSGTAIYRTTFTAIAPKSDERILLDLGEVNLIAEVNLNGKKVGIDWLPPFQLDVTEQLQAGENHLEISVTNLWSNRLIGEERYPEHFDGYKIDRVGNGNYTKFRMVDWYKNNHPPPAGPRTTFTTADFYNKDDALLPSGLLGPVQLLAHKVLASAPAAASTK